MDLYAIIDQIEALLQKHGRVSYRSIKLQFKLDDEYLETVKEELVDIRELALDNDGKMLVWKGAVPVSNSTLQVSGFQPLTPSTQPPVTYTPPHLAERILAEQVAM